MCLNKKYYNDSDKYNNDFYTYHKYNNKYNIDIIHIFVLTLFQNRCIIKKKSKGEVVWQKL